MLPSQLSCNLPTHSPQMVPSKRLTLPRPNGLPPVKLPSPFLWAAMSIKHMYVYVGCMPIRLYGLLIWYGWLFVLMIYSGYHY